MTADLYKRQAAAKAIQLVRPGMRLGLGTGSTAEKFVALLGERVAAGLDVVCVATSERTAMQARELGIRLSTLDDTPYLDLTVDGADELDGRLNMIKGGGGALLREKIVATASERVVVIADASKRVETLGAFPLPVEVVRFGLSATRNLIEMLAGDAGCRGHIRVRTGQDGQPFVTDGGNYILDCAFGRIERAELLDEALKAIPGVVENGLFLGIADIGFIAGPGGVEELAAETGERGAAD
jgi:ribose 5-phosphate isomerase A